MLFRPPAEGGGGGGAGDRISPDNVNNKSWDLQVDCVSTRGAYRELWYLYSSSWTEHLF